MSSNPASLPRTTIALDANADPLSLFASEIGVKPADAAKPSSKKPPGIVNTLVSYVPADDFLLVDGQQQPTSSNHGNPPGSTKIGGSRAATQKLGYGSSVLSAQAQSLQQASWLGSNGSTKSVQSPDSNNGDTINLTYNIKGDYYVPSNIGSSGSASAMGSVSGLGSGLGSVGGATAGAGLAASSIGRGGISRGSNSPLSRKYSSSITSASSRIVSSGSSGGGAAAEAVAAAATAAAYNAAGFAAGTSAAVTEEASDAAAASSAGNLVDEEAERIPFLSGEHKVMNLVDVHLHISSVHKRSVAGVFFMTNYRLIFLPAAVDMLALSQKNPSIYSMLSIPLASIDRIDREKKSSSSSSSSSRSEEGITLSISCKDVRSLRVTVKSKYNNGASNEYDIERAIGVMSAYAFPNNMRYLFAYSHKLEALANDRKDYSQYWNLTREFTRQGVVDSSRWRISICNENYKLCRSYPRMLVVPATILDDELTLIANFRSGQRLPVLCYGWQENAATMWRSSQPKAGVSGSCMQDEKLLDTIARSCGALLARSMVGGGGAVSSVSGSSSSFGYSGSASGDAVLHIADLRSRASAMANRATGAGYESQSNYPTCKLEFYSIPNIHAVRDSYRSLSNVVLQGASPSVGSSGDVSFSKQVEDTMWLTNVRLIIKASWETAAFMTRNEPVLVHCSHGWDRTAQVCSLAQLFLDPFFRTFEGFPVLLEKEWCTFGHPFQMRSAHTQDRQNRQDDQMSFIFIQFLDTVWQVLRQFPHYFEFNARYLLTIADHAFSGRFGNFLYNCDYDREVNNARQQCADLWRYLYALRAQFANPLYLNPLNPESGTERILLPNLASLQRGVCLWSDYFMRWSFLPFSPRVPSQLARFLYADGENRPLTLPPNALPPSSSSAFPIGDALMLDSGFTPPSSLTAGRPISGDHFAAAAAAAAATAATAATGSAAAGGAHTLSGIIHASHAVHVAPTGAPTVGTKSAGVVKARGDKFSNNNDDDDNNNNIGSSEKMSGVRVASQTATTTPRALSPTPRLGEAFLRRVSSMESLFRGKSDSVDAASAAAAVVVNVAPAVAAGTVGVAEDLGRDVSAEGNSGEPPLFAQSTTDVELVDPLGLESAFCSEATFSDAGGGSDFTSSSFPSSPVGTTGARTLPLGQASAIYQQGECSTAVDNTVAATAGAAAAIAGGGSTYSARADTESGAPDWSSPLIQSAGSGATTGAVVAGSGRTKGEIDQTPEWAQIQSTNGTDSVVQRQGQQLFNDYTSSGSGSDTSNNKNYNKNNNNSSSSSSAGKWENAGESDTLYPRNHRSASAANISSSSSASGSSSNVRDIGLRGAVSEQAQEGRAVENSSSSGLGSGMERTADAVVLGTDYALYAMATSTDFWEAAYRMERCRRLALESVVCSLSDRLNSSNNNYNSSTNSASIANNRNSSGSQRSNHGHPAARIEGVIRESPQQDECMQSLELQDVHPQQDPTQRQSGWGMELTEREKQQQQEEEEEDTRDLVAEVSASREIVDQQETVIKKLVELLRNTDPAYTEDYIENYLLNAGGGSALAQEEEGAKDCGMPSASSRSTTQQNDTSSSSSSNNSNNSSSNSDRGSTIIGSASTAGQSESASAVSDWVRTRNGDIYQGAARGHSTTKATNAAAEETTTTTRDVTHSLDDSWDLGSPLSTTATAGAPAFSSGSAAAAAAAAAAGTLKGISDSSGSSGGGGEPEFFV